LISRTFRSAASGLIISSSVLAQPELLTWDEHVTPYRQDQPPAPLAAKLQALLTTPFVSNSASEPGGQAEETNLSAVGNFSAGGSVDIERGLEFDAVRLAFSDPQGFNAVRSLLSKTISGTGPARRYAARGSWRNHSFKASLCRRILLRE
jgi:hypothetical protein